MPDSSSFPPFPPLSALSRPNSDSPPFTEKDGLACTQQHVQVASCRNTRQYYCTCRLPASSSKLQRSLLKLRPGPLPSAPCALLPSAYLPAPANESAVRGTRVVHEAKTLLDRRTCRPPVPAPTRWHVCPVVGAQRSPLLVNEDMSIDEVICSGVTRAQSREISSAYSRALLQSLNDDDACPGPTFLACFPRQVPALLLFIYLSLTPTKPGESLRADHEGLSNLADNKPPPRPRSATVL